MNFKRQKGMSQENGTFTPVSSIRVNADLTIDLEGGYLYYKKSSIPLARKEHQVLCILAQKRQTSQRGYCRIEELVKQMYPRDSEVIDKPRAIQETIYRLRKKFALLPGCEHIIEGRPGWGYRLDISDNTNQTTL